MDDARMALLEAIVHASFITSCLTISAYLMRCKASENGLLDALLEEMSPRGQQTRDVSETFKVGGTKTNERKKEGSESLRVQLHANWCWKFTLAHLLLPCVWLATCCLVILGTQVRQKLRRSQSNLTKLPVQLAE
eukprot:6476243-Amphidinium_carterae.1